MGKNGAKQTSKSPKAGSKAPSSFPALIEGEEKGPKPSLVAECADILLGLRSGALGMQTRSKGQITEQEGEGKAKTKEKKRQRQSSSSGTAASMQNGGARHVVTSAAFSATLSPSDAERRGGSLSSGNMYETTAVFSPCTKPTSAPATPSLSFSGPYRTMPSLSQSQGCVGGGEEKAHLLSQIALSNAVSASAVQKQYNVNLDRVMAAQSLTPRHFGEMIPASNDRIRQEGGPLYSFQPSPSPSVSSSQAQDEALSSSSRTSSDAATGSRQTTPTSQIETAANPQELVMEPPRKVQVVQLKQPLRKIQPFDLSKAVSARAVREGGVPTSFACHPPKPVVPINPSRMGASQFKSIYVEGAQTSYQQYPQPQHNSSQAAQPAVGSTTLTRKGNDQTPTLGPCNCRKSQCLKLYCQCFAAGLLCQDCNCRNCQNKKVTGVQRQKAIQELLLRKPNAFESKVVADGRKQGKHKFGCRCKKSACLKKYCECYQAGVPCSDSCSCTGCKNQGHQHNKKSPQSESISVGQTSQPQSA